MSKEIVVTENHQLREYRSIWDKTVAVEESNYFWKYDPLIFLPQMASIDDREHSIAEFFSGCGGTSTGFEMAGYNTILGIDIHRPSVETFRNYHKNAVAILSDIKKVSPEMIRKYLGNKEIDVMVAGVPCQGFSLNNRKRWKDDKRNFLFLEFIRFVEKFKPRAVLLENVSGLKTTANGSFVEAITEAIENAGDYHVSSRMLNAADFGVPQLRERFFFVGVPKEKEFIWPEPSHGPDTNQQYRTVFDAIADLPEINAGEEAHEYTRPGDRQYQRMMRNGTKELFNHKAPKHPGTTIERISSTEPGEPMYQKFRQRIRLSWERPSPTQVSGGIRPQFQFGHPEQDRGLTVRERCRIQSFPDDYIIHGGVVQGRVQTGNAVPPLLAKAIAKSIKNVLPIRTHTNKE